MDVIKKDGRIQKFDIIKIRSSILNASIDSNIIINEEDLKVVSNIVFQSLKNLRSDNSCTSTYEIFAIIIETLDKDGFSDIAISYLEYKNNSNK